MILAAEYAAPTYIVPFLEDVTGVRGAVVSGFLLAFGVASAVGSISGGRFADVDARRTLTACAALLAATLAVVVAFGKSPIVMLVALIAWGAVGFGVIPSFQYRVVELAGPGGAIASSLPVSGANVGIAVGSLLPK